VEKFVSRVIRVTLHRTSGDQSERSENPNHGRKRVDFHSPDCFHPVAVTGSPVDCLGLGSLAVYVEQQTAPLSSAYPVVRFLQRVVIAIVVGFCLS
jgi:hypothetical protein